MMNWNDVAGDWAEYSKKAHSNWNKLSLEQVQKTDGSRDALSKLIQAGYQCNTQEAESQIDDWLNNLMGHTQTYDESIDEKLKENQDTAETIEEQNEVMGSPYHRGIY
ncbi:MAG TPA: hypothetical protein VK949_07810 [Methylotenera sp.]|nr:hypothetical protein [Methylotenera sp.]